MNLFSKILTFLTSTLAYSVSLFLYTGLRIFRMSVTRTHDVSIFRVVFVSTVKHGYMT